MDITTACLLAGAIAYLAGSIPFGYLTALLVSGQDIRRVGSGNIGATNVARCLGARWGFLVLFLDALKGFLPTWFVPLLLVLPASGELMHLRVLCGIATVLGHMFPVWLRFRGGKGVATALGVILTLGWQSSIIAAAVFAVVFAVTRIISLSSMVAAVIFAAAQFVQLRPDPFSADQWSLAAFSLLIPLLIIARHRSNIGRLLRGEEPRFGQRSSSAASAESTAAGDETVAESEPSNASASG